MSSLFFFLLQLNAQCKEDDNDNDVLKRIIVIYCFVAMQLHEEDDNMGIFLHLLFYFIVVVQCTM